MFTRFKFPLKGIYKVKVYFLLLALIFITGAHGDPITQNELEDIKIIFSQFIRQDPNVLFVMDGSLSMADNFAGQQIGNWDTGARNDVIKSCNLFQNVNTNYARAHCMGNASGTNPCGSSACSGSQVGACERLEDFERLVSCIEDTYSSAIDINDVFTTVIPNACGGITVDPLTECTTNTERAHAAAAMEVYALQQANLVDDVAFPLNCAAAFCGGTDKSCNTSTERNNVESCLGESNSDPDRIQPTVEICTSGLLCSKGKYGSTRFDGVLSTIFDFLDADNSLDDLMCDDTDRLFDGVNSSISCMDFMYTPFRSVNEIAGDCSSGGPDQLPITGASDIDLIDVLTFSDAELLEIRFRSMIFSGSSATTSSSGFTGGTSQALENVWEFYDCREAGGRTPLANALGFDDNNSQSTGFRNDALSAFRNDLQTDLAALCRPQFVIVFSDGEDTRSGDCGELPGSCSSTPATTGNANRRSSVQAVSNLRTYYVRNPVTNGGEQIKKEILTFVIGIGVEDPQARRTLNAMALAGGTHTTGIIKHENPFGDMTRGVDINSLLPGGSAFDPFKTLARTDGLGTNPTNATLQGCLTPNEDLTSTAPNTGVHCHIGGEDIFFNAFFNTGDPFPAGQPFENNEFAFFVNSPEELSNALQDISGSLRGGAFSGVSPVAPQSAAFVGARDRILLLPFRPIVDKRFWQGRLALYGFVPEPPPPGNPPSGSRIVIRKPGPSDDITDLSTVDGLKIFNDDGTLNLNAQEFFWEAGKNLAELEITTDDNPRNLLTVETDPTFTDTSIVDTSNGNIRYIYKSTDNTIEFDKDNTVITPDYFGISNFDVADGAGNIPTFCADDNNPTLCKDDYTDPSSSTVDCSVTTDPDCQACVKECIRDRIIDFMSGNTEIEPGNDPIDDPLGISTTDDCPATGDGIIGCGCPDSDLGTGSFDQCSVRLGTIFNSVPTIVASPSPLFFDTGFQPFAIKYRNRAAAVYAGANDGFMHGFHAGNFVNPSIVCDPQDSCADSKNPFTNVKESVAFFNAGSGKEVMAFTTPSFFPDSTSSVSPDTPAANGTPEFRFGDFKSFITENQIQRSFFDGSTLAADVFIDGFSNNITKDSSICPDASATITSPDGLIDECGREWHTVLLAGLRNGGGVYTALDVTNFACSGGDVEKGFKTSDDKCDVVKEHITGDLDYPEHLWTLFEQDFGNTWSTPTIGRARLELGNGDFTDRWLLFVGGGLHPTDTDPTDGVSLGNGFYAIDIATGKIVFKFHPTNTVPSTIEDQPTNVSGIGVASDNNITKMTCDMAAKVGAFDINADGYIDIVLGGDTCGRLWEFDVSKPIVTNASVSQTGIDGNAEFEAEDWTGHILFCATGTDTECGDPTQIDNLPVADDGDEIDREPIFFDPTVVIDDIGRRHVILVNGNRRNLSDPEQSGKLYNFIDPFIPAFLGGASSSGATTIIAGTKFNSTNTIEIVEDTNNPGFFTTSTSAGFDPNGEFAVIFPDNVGTINGEKGIGTPIVIQRLIVFTTFAPPVSDPNNPCASVRGEGRVFSLDFLTGEPALARIPGAKPLLEDRGVSDSELESIVGLTAAEGVPAPAQLTFGSRGSVLVTIAFSGGPGDTGGEFGGGTFLVWELPPFATRTQTLYWEEIL